jgi:glycosyltransferase involved in cell wall biosynthesis
MKVSICIANYKQDHLLPDLISSIESQDYNNIETCIYHDKEGVGTGEAFNRAIALAKGDVIILMCADDVFTCSQVVSDIVGHFKTFPDIVHVSRYYHQFNDGDRSPVRAWRCNDIIELANNPSGLAFRKSAIGDSRLSNKMFVEASSFVSSIIKNKFYAIIKYDTVAVRIHQSISRTKDYYLKRWTSSPVEEWAKVGGKSLANDFTSLIQIKNYFTLDVVIKEAISFIKVNPINIIKPAFWFFTIISVATPRTLLLRIPHWYRITFGKWTTRKVCRPS